MDFRDPRWLWALAAVPFATLFLVAREKARERLARRFVAERLRGQANTVRPIRPWLIAGGLLLAVVALAGPRRGFTSVPIVQHEASRVIVLDVSNSMLAQDLGTSRLAVAKAIARRLIDAWPGRIGLVEFEAAAEVVSPLTDDSGAVEALLDSVQAGEVGSPGSDLGEALFSALRLVESEPGARADVVLISDGEDQGTKLDAAIAKARQRGVVVSTILVGSRAGSTIPQPDGEVLHDADGKVVVTAAHPDMMRKIAAGTGGAFFENAFGEHSVDALLAPRGATVARQRNVRVPIDRFQWPLAMAFLVLFLGSLANRGAE